MAQGVQRLSTDGTPRRTLLIVGGAEDKLGRSVVLKRFVRLAGGRQSRIVIIPTASSFVDEVVETYSRVFTRLRAGPDIGVVHAKSRAAAHDPELVARLDDATAVFMSGGSQLKLSQFLVGTPVGDAIIDAYRRGVVVAGTSAGASIVSAHLMAGGTGLTGDSSDAAARKGMVELVAGFGLLQDVIVDQHFSQRGRMGRLLATFAANPGLLGIGLDEDTAVLIDRDGMLEVLGSNMVTIVDGRDATSDYYQREVGEVLTVVRSSLSVLGPGRRFNLNTRQPVDFSQ